MSLKILEKYLPDGFYDDIKISCNDSNPEKCTNQTSSKDLECKCKGLKPGSKYYSQLTVNKNGWNSRHRTLNNFYTSKTN